MIRKRQFAEAPATPTLREAALRYIALGLSFVLILSALTLRADSPFRPSFADAVHGNMNGFLPFPSTELWMARSAPNSKDRLKRHAAPPALIAPGIELPPQGDELPVDSQKGNISDSAFNLQHPVSVPDRTQAKHEQSSNQSGPISIHTPPPMSFDGD